MLCDNKSLYIHTKINLRVKASGLRFALICTTTRQNRQTERKKKRIKVQLGKTQVPQESYRHYNISKLWCFEDGSGLNLVLTHIRQIHKTINIDIKVYIITDVIRMSTIYNEAVRTLIK